MKIRCIAVDDEPLALDIMEDYIRQIDYLEFLKGFHNPLDVIGYLKDNTADLLFLDIQMSKLTGIQLLEVIKNLSRNTPGGAFVIPGNKMINNQKAACNPNSCTFFMPDI